MNAGILIVLMILNIIMSLNPEANIYVRLFSAFASGVVAMALFVIYDLRH